MNNRGFFRNKLLFILVLLFPLFLALSQFFTLVMAKTDWDKSSLVFDGSCSANCSKVEAKICNHGDKDMEGTSNYEVWYKISGNPKDGSNVGSGTIPELKKDHCATLSFSPQANGNYMFKAFQRPGHPGIGELWSETCLVSGCNFATPTPTATSNPTPTPTVVPTQTANPTCTPKPSATVEPTATPNPSPTPSSNPTNSPTPTATPVPGPTSTPGPEDGKHSYLGKNGPSCEQVNFEVTYDLKEDGKGQKDIEVTIEYNGDKKTVKTNEGGRAQVYFDYNGEGTIYADDNGDYPSQSLHVNALDCPSTGVGGAILGTTTSSTDGGKILGASTSTLGATGTFEEDMLRTIIGFIIGVVFYIVVNSKFRLNIA